VGVAVRVPCHAGIRPAAEPAHEQLDPVPCRADPVLVGAAAKVGELLGEPPLPSAMLDAGRLVVLDAGAECEPERQSPPRECVHRGGLLGEERRRAERGDRDHRRQPHAGGDRGRSGESREGLEAVVDHAVEHGQARERPGVRAPRPFEHERAVRARRRRGKADADVHACVRVRVREGLHLTEVMCQT
jgi:hypothetical protein